jgi:L-iditol 2-dehydrogenase
MNTAILNKGIVHVKPLVLNEVDSGDMLLHVEYCGICGTDYQKYLNFPYTDDWGHEVIGTVDGERVLVRSTFPCGKCIACLRNQHEKCCQWKRKSKNGFSDYIVIDKRCVIFIDEETEFLEYILAEPLNVAINLVNRVNPEQDDSFLIVGNGTIGLLSAFYLRSLGCENITIMARTTDGIRKQFTESLGVETYRYDEGLSNALCESNKIINTAPYETMNDIINNALPHSVITFNGISKNVQVTLDINTWHFKNLTISPSFPHPQCEFKEAIALIREHHLKLSPLITHTFSLQEMNHALRLMKHKEIDYIKVLIKP